MTIKKYGNNYVCWDCGGINFCFCLCELPISRFRWWVKSWLCLIKLLFSILSFGYLSTSWEEINYSQELPMLPDLICGNCGELAITCGYNC